MIEARKQILKAKLAAASTPQSNRPVNPGTAQSQSSTPAAVRSQATQERQPFSSVYAQFPSPLDRPHNPSGRQHATRSPSPKSWNGSFSEEDGDTRSMGASNSSISSEAPPVPRKDSQYIHRTRHAAVGPTRAPPPPPPASYHRLPSKNDTSASQSAAARAYTRTQHSYERSVRPIPPSRPLATTTRSTPCTTYSYPPAKSFKGHMNCQGRYLQIGTLRGPKPSEMAWVDGVMHAAYEKAGSKESVDKKQKALGKGVKQIRKWLRNENRVTVEYVIDYVGERYGVNV